MTATDLLDLLVPTRVDGFRFDLLDQQHRRIGELRVGADSVPSITLDTTRTTFRTVDGLHIVKSDLNDIDPVNDRVQPWMVLSTGDAYPLGVFMFGDDVRAPYSWGIDWTPSLFDEAFILDQGLDASIGGAPGSSLLELYAKLIDRFDLPDVVINVADKPVPGTTPLTFPAGDTTTYKACASIAPLLGAFPPFFNENGAWDLEPALTPGATPAPDHVYEVGQLSRIIDGTTRTSSSSYKAPNRWIVLGGTTDTPIIGRYDLPDSSPNSAAQRSGLVVTAPTITMQGIDQATADLAAYAAALTDRNTYATAEFAGSADPRHGTFDVVQFMGDLYLETGWRLECFSGGKHTHSLTKLYL